MAEKKKKIASTFPNMVLVLTVIAIVSALSLGFIYTITEEPIRLGKIERKNKAIKAVLPEFENKEEKKFDASVIHVAKDKTGEYVGAAVESEAMGFTQEVKLMVGFDNTDKIVKISVVEQKETPGLGTKMEGEWKDQFIGKDLSKFKSKVKKDKGDVDSITAATISSRAFCKAVKIAYDNLKLNKPKFLKAESKEEVKKEVEKIEVKTEEVSEKKTAREMGGKK